MISVITASLPTRSAMLAECVASVAAQTLSPWEHLIGVDHGRRGPSAIRNELLETAQGVWIAIVDDDDVLFPNHLERLRSVDADIVYSYCSVEGRAWSPNREFDADALRAGNYIPATVLIDASFLRRLGGWREDTVYGWEDWDLYLRALDAGGTFACVPEVTWRYRFHGGNRTNRGDDAA